jgi:hypothetical protein
MALSLQVATPMSKKQTKAYYVVFIGYFMRYQGRGPDRIPK